MDKKHFEASGSERPSSTVATNSWFKFSRIITAGRPFIPTVDGLRFIAILAVVLFHLREYTLAKHMSGASLHLWEVGLSRVLGAGHYGVQLFFVLSGFLLAMPFAKWRLGFGTRPELKRYYLRRLTRLEPPYILALLLTFAGIILVNGAKHAHGYVPSLIASLLYQHNIFFNAPSYVASIAWSLEVEVQFYVLAPVLARVFSIQNMIVRRVFLAGIAVAAPPLRLLGARYGLPTFGLSLPGYIEFFAVGFLLSDFYLVNWKERPTCSRIWDILGVPAWFFLIVSLTLDIPKSLHAPLILFAYVCAFRGTVLNRILSYRGLTTIGGMCYSMYLLHYPVISAVGRLAQRFQLGTSFSSRYLVEFFFGVPAVLVVTGAFFVFIERPCMDPGWITKVAAALRRKSRGVGPQLSQ
jgi:peptidoglycan/LPS O-acetylase OafA/YrhL